MNIPTTYLWQPVYLDAVLETDNVAMPTRIYEALAAIEQRLLSPIEAGGVEYRAIEDAQRGLLTLKAEQSRPSAQTRSELVESDSRGVLAW
jgi:hypothetical protein